MMLRLVLGFVWCLLHLFVSFVHITSHLSRLLLYSIISSGLLRMYKNLDLQKLHYLAVVVDSEEARNTKQVKRLLHWISEIGVKYVILYDMEGVLKESLDTRLNGVINSSAKSLSDPNLKTVISFISQESMMIELLSFTDNKEGVAKAASFLCTEYLKGDGLASDKKEPIFTETDMTHALKAIGCGGPDPDLLLVYGPARCHLGFPAWRMRYTEIVHMGPLKSMRYGAIIKTIYDFSKKHQNYGT